MKQYPKYFESPLDNDPKYPGRPLMRKRAEELRARLGPEFIVAAAICDRSTGVIHSLPAPARHGDVMHSLPRRADSQERYRDQGFCTNYGRFVGREEGMEIAAAADQLLPRAPTGPNHILFSEDVW